MNKKYFETKTGSIEEKITRIATEQQSIKKQEPNVKLTVEKTYFETKPGSISDVAAKIVSEALDPVNKAAVKKKFDDRKDKDIDNDGDTDSTDKYLHKKRAAISKNIKEEQEASCGCGSECAHCKGIHSRDEIGKKCECCDNEIKSVAKEAVDNPYAVGMAQAMKSKNDEPPLKKSTITKAHDIAKSIMKKESKTFSQLRTETKVIKLGDKGKTATGKEAGAVDVEPRAIPV